MHFGFVKFFNVTRSKRVNASKCCISEYIEEKMIDNFKLVQ